MQDLNDKITGGTVSAAEWNQQPTELQNIITQRGITLSGADLNQVGKAIAGYVANGTFFTDSGVADAYVLTQIGTIQAAPNYRDGDEIVFFPLNNSTGASVTVNRAGAGVVDLKDSVGVDIGANGIAVGSLVVARFSAANNQFRLVPALSQAQFIDVKNGRKNELINGDFMISLRGNNFPSPAGDDVEYTIDQWAYDNQQDGGSLLNSNVERVTFPIGQTDVPNNPFRHGLFSGYVSGGGGDDYVLFRNNRVNVKSLYDRTITWSFWAKGSLGGDIGILCRRSFGVGSIDIPDNPFTSNITLSTGWQKYSFTFTMPTIAGKDVQDENFNAFCFITHLGATKQAELEMPSTLNYQGTVEIADVQVEIGSIGTDFDRIGRDEVRQLCAAYLQEYNWSSNSMSVGRANSSGNIIGTAYSLYDKMRQVPTTIIKNTANTASVRINGSAATATTQPFTVTSDGEIYRIDVIAAGANNGDFYAIDWNGIDAPQWYLSAELP